MRPGSSMGEIQGTSTSEHTDRRGWQRRTRRNIAAATLLVYGSTFLWMTSSFAGTNRPPGGAAWVIADVGALVSLALFTLAAWGVFRSKWRWERAASAIRCSDTVTMPGGERRADALIAAAPSRAGSGSRRGPGRTARASTTGPGSRSGRDGSAVAGTGCWPAARSVTRPRSPITPATGRAAPARRTWRGSRAAGGISATRSRRSAACWSAWSRPAHPTPRTSGAGPGGVGDASTRPGYATTGATATHSPEWPASGLMGSSGSGRPCARRRLRQRDQRRT